MQKAPQILIIGLYRFTKDKEEIKKREENIIFPLSLDLTVFADSETSLIYDCFAVNNHEGDMSNGHYYAFCKEKNDKWYKYDDEKVSELHNGEVITPNAYSLFYRLRDKAVATLTPDLDIAL